MTNKMHTGYGVHPTPPKPTPTLAQRKAQAQSKAEQAMAHDALDSLDDNQLYALLLTHFENRAYSRGGLSARKLEKFSNQVGRIAWDLERSTQ